MDSDAVGGLTTLTTSSHSRSLLVQFFVVVFFFFQAEDGIRDTSVTGVQTCALPISPARSSSSADESLAHLVFEANLAVDCNCGKSGVMLSSGTADLLGSAAAELRKLASTVGRFVSVQPDRKSVV